MHRMQRKTTAMFIIPRTKTSHCYDSEHDAKSIQSRNHLYSKKAKIIKSSLGPPFGTNKRGEEITTWEVRNRNKNTYVTIQT